MNTIYLPNGKKTTAGDTKQFNIYEREMDGNNVILSEALLSLYVPVANKKDYKPIIIRATTKENAINIFFIKYGILEEEKPLYFATELERG